MGNSLCCTGDSGSRSASEAASHAHERTLAAAKAAAAGWHPISSTAPDVFECIHLINAGSVCVLPVPWPRCQDLSKEHFLEPECDTLVLAVSHGWTYQAHPDPTGSKGAMVKALVDDAVRAHKPSGHTLCFLDFCSVPQRRFRAGQAERTSEEKRRFDSALLMMPDIYLLADAVLHLDTDTTERVKDSLVCVDATDLEGVCLQQMGPHVQVWRSANSRVLLFDVIATCDGMSGLNLGEVARKLDAARAAGRACPVELRRIPFGLRNDVPASKRGWVFLERFATMVKAAMADEADFERICFSNSQAVLDQVRAGSAMLRKAALAGEKHIKHELDLFCKELDKLHFSGASTDKILGTASHSDGPQESDCQAVKRIMCDMVAELPALWMEEQRWQRQRHLLMAVNRGDVDNVAALLRAAADVNHRGKAGERPLHKAALLDNIDVARTLLEHRADVSLQDAQGNCAGHLILLMMSDHIVPFMELLVPTHDIMELRNSRQVTPLQRFRTWAVAADGNRPFPPALAYLERVWESHPTLRSSQGFSGSRMVSLLSSGGQLLRRRGQDIQVGDLSVRVEEWARGRMGPEVHVLCFCFGATPPEMQEAAWDTVATELRSRCPVHVRLFALTRISGLRCGLSLAEVQERLLRVVEALPLHSKFVLVDDTSGMVAGLLMKLRPRLSGVFLINSLWCVSEEFLHSTPAARAVGYFRKISRQPDAEMLSTVLANSTYAEDDDDGLQRSKEACFKVLEHENRDYFDSQAWFYAALADELATSMSTFYQEGLAWPFTVPARLACGAFAAEGLVVQSMVRLQELFPNSTFSYIPNSKLLFQLEGDEQLSVVLEVLEGLLHQVDLEI